MNAFINNLPEQQTKLLPNKAMQSELLAQCKSDNIVQSQSARNSSTEKENLQTEKNFLDHYAHLLFTVS